MNRNEGPADEASDGRMESDGTAMGEPGSRRRFLKGGLAAAAGVAATSMWDATTALAQESDVSAAPGPPSRIDDEAYWEKVRAQFHLNPDTIYLNNGTLGLCPKPVTQAVYDGYVYLAEAGSEGRSQLWDEVEASRKTAARFLGADENVKWC